MIGITSTPVAIPVFATHAPPAKRLPTAVERALKNAMMQSIRTVAEATHIEFQVDPNGVLVLKRDPKAVASVSPPPRPKT